MQKQSDLRGVSILKKISSGMPVTMLVKDGAAKLGARNMIVGEAIEGQDSDFQESIADSGLPLADGWVEGHQALHPLVGAIDGGSVPTGGADVERAGASVEAGVEGGGAAKDAGSGVDDAVLGDEALGGGGRGGVGEREAEGGQVGDVRVAVRGATAFQQQYPVLLGQCGCQRAPRGTPSYYDVVVVGDGRSSACTLHESIIRNCCK